MRVPAIVWVAALSAFGQAPAEAMPDKTLDLRHAESEQHVQEIATVVRSVGDIRWLFIYPPPKVMAVRGTAGQIAMAEWLINELDKPVKKAASGGSAYLNAQHAIVARGTLDEMALAERLIRERDR
jgi:hypothetical protein